MPRLYAAGPVLVAGAVKAVLATLVVVVAITVGLVLAAETPTDRPASPAQVTSPRLDREMSEHHCSPTGFGPRVQPRSALIRTAGAIRHVPFSHGWSVFTGDRPGTLLAVCRLPASRS